MVLIFSIAATTCLIRSFFFSPFLGFLQPHLVNKVLELKLLLQKLVFLLQLLEFFVEGGLLGLLRRFLRPAAFLILYPLKQGGQSPLFPLVIGLSRDP